MTDAMKTAANNDQPARTTGHFEPETRIISQAMYVLAKEIQSGDGVANAVCRQAAERLDAQTVEIERLRAALRTTQEPVAWIRGSGMEMLNLENGGVATVYASPGMSNHSVPLYTTPPDTTALLRKAEAAEWVAPVSELLGHLSDVLSDEEFGKVSTTKWNAVSSMVATKGRPQAEAVATARHSVQPADDTEGGEA